MYRARLAPLLTGETGTRRPPCPCPRPTPPLTAHPPARDAAAAVRRRRRSPPRLPWSPSPAATGAAPVGAAPASATACSVVWGSLAKTSAPLADRSHHRRCAAGRHACYDRLVRRHDRPSARLRRALRAATVHAEGPGNPVPVAGGARLAVSVHKGATSMPAMPSVAGYSTFRQVTLGRVVRGVQRRSRSACGHDCRSGCSRSTTGDRRAAASSSTSPTTGEPGRRAR